MKRLLLLAAGGLAGALVAAPAAHATTVSVSIMNFGFSPASATAAQGSTVTWTQRDVGVQHTSTSNQGFWASARLNAGQTFSVVLWSAGSFGYHCAVHPEMTGVVHVPLRAAGSASTGWTVRWSSQSGTPVNRAFDVQIKRPGSTTWAGYRTDVTSHTAFFNPSKTGSYAFRARTRNLSNGTSSGWSPAKSLLIS